MSNLSLSLAYESDTYTKQFIAQSQDIPSIGKVQLSWAPNLPNANSKPASVTDNSAPGSPSAMTGVEDTGMGGGGADTSAGAVSAGGAGAVGAGGEEFDVADDEDRWMAA